MTDAKPPDPQAAAIPPATEPSTEAVDKGERIGTILMVVAISAVAVLVLDVALKGKLLAPLFALLPAPKNAATEEPPDAAPRPPDD